MASGNATFGRVGSGTLAAIRGVGKVSLVAARACAGLVGFDARELMRSFGHFGFDSIPLALAVAVLAGATVVLQTGLYVERFGARTLLGWAGGHAILWEFGPLLLGLLVGARVGARNAAELAVMRVGGVLEGLRGISLDPFALLIAPRVVALTVDLILLNALADLVAVLCEAIAAIAVLRLPSGVFLESFSTLLGPWDLVAGEVKAAAFGLAIALISTAAGLSAKGGARAVGRAASSAVMWSSAVIFALDLILTVLLSRVIR